jgi:serine/threonine-protein kinase
MGEVYRARDLRLDRTVAIKVLAERVNTDPAYRLRFEREARAIAVLTHPHICTLYDLGHHEGIDFLVMEYLDGHTLADRLTKGPLPLDRAVAIARDIADALDTAHRQGIVHRDLKPGNVMLTKDGAKLLDFGIATLRPIEHVSGGANTAETVTVGLTSPNAIVGTLPYMTPEQLEGREVDARTDIYAFGVVLYEMLTGKLPFDGKTQPALIAAIMSGAVEPIAQLQPLVPPSLANLVTTCLVRDPDGRWQSARDIAHGLKSAAESVVVVRDEPAIRQLRRRERYAWIAAGLGLTAALTASLLSSSRPEPRPAAAAVHATIPLAAGQRLSMTETPSFAISRDGSKLAYVAVTADGATELYIRQLDSATTSPVADSAGATYPQFAPDGNSIAFFAAEGLRRVPLSGGAPVIVTASGTFSGVRGLSWGADGYFTVSTYQTGLMRVADTGGIPALLTTPDYDTREKSHRWPFILPGAQALLMTVSTADANTFDDARAEVLRIGSGVRTKVIDGGSFARYVPTGHVVFARAGALFAAPFNLQTLEVTGVPVKVVTPVRTEPAFGHAHFDISDTGTLAYIASGARRDNRTILWVDEMGKSSPAVIARRPFYEARVSPDGLRVATVVEGATSEVWLHDLTADKSMRLTDGWDNVNPIWTPDGERIVFASTRTRRHTHNLFWQASDGTGKAEQLLSSDMQQSPVAVSSDGKSLLFTQRADLGRWQMHTLSLVDRSSTLVPEAPAIVAQQPALSPDGQWVAYYSDRSGRDEVYIQAFPRGGRQWQVSIGGGQSPIWARNGKELFYRHGDAVMAVPIEAGAAVRAGTPKLLFKTALIGPLDVARDGRLLMIEPEKEDLVSELSVVVNWFDELKRVIAAPR